MLPDFLIIGAQRGGTTSLHRYLCAHPGVLPATKKEIRFFDLNFARGLDWYRAHFPLQAARFFRPGRVVTGEATPYYLYHPAAPHRAREVAPGVRLLALLRNPVDRAVSHYHLEIRAGHEDLPFQAALERELEKQAAGQAPEDEETSLTHRRQSYLSRGVYADQLQRWMSAFPREQLLVLSSERFYAEPAAVIEEALAFVGLPLRHPAEYRRYNDGGYAPLEPGARRRLVDYFAPHNERLYELLGERFDWDR
jgi:hypothetical protein